MIAAHLPVGSGVVLRDDSLPCASRWRLLRQLARIAVSRRLILLIAAPPATARRWGADGVYLRHPMAHLAAQAKTLGQIVGMPVHDKHEARTARRSGAAFAFISPIHPTRSHPGAPTLSSAQLVRLARTAAAHPIALGGMNGPRARHLHRQLAASNITPGWAAIDDWGNKADARLRRQKRNCVPT